MKKSLIAIFIFAVICLLFAGCKNNEQSNSAFQSGDMSESAETQNIEIGAVDETENKAFESEENSNQESSGSGNGSALESTLSSQLTESAKEAESKASSTVNNESSVISSADETESSKEQESSKDFGSGITLPEDEWE